MPVMLDRDMRVLHRPSTPTGTVQVRDLDLSAHPRLANIAPFVQRVNAYLSTRGAVCDEHAEAFPVAIIQAAGEKRWTVDGDAMTLVPGDVLFIDADVPHSTYTPSWSIHFTAKIDPTGGPHGW